MAEPGDRDYHRRNLIVDRDLALRAMEWHGGQGSSVYSFASTAMNDYVSPSMIDDAVSELESKNRKRHTKKSLKKLDQLIGDLDAVARYSDEYTTLAVLGEDEDSGYADWLREENPKEPGLQRHADAPGDRFAYYTFDYGGHRFFIMKHASKKWEVEALDDRSDRQVRDGVFKGTSFARTTKLLDRQRVHGASSLQDAIKKIKKAVKNEGSTRGQNPMRGKRVPISRKGYCVKPTEYFRDGKLIEREGYCVKPTKYYVEDKGTPGIRSFGAKSGARSRGKIDPKTGKPYKPLISREGKLGGPGYTSKPAKKRHKILEACVDEYGYRSCLGSVMVLLKNSEISAKVRKTLTSDKEWLMKKYGGPGSFGPRSGNPDPVRFEIERARRELELYIDNDYQLHQMAEAIGANLRRKQARGTYDPKKAPKAWLHLVNTGARKYVKAFGGTVGTVFPLQTVRQPLAEDYARYWEEEERLRAGNPYQGDAIERARQRKYGFPPPPHSKGRKKKKKANSVSAIKRRCLR
jgi:hypothetical protein